ncbi:shikimate dehydrogenase [Acetohalobium arabaticum]|uniref:Shikimate dehydrogenase (NADP(+)) n=1 Tax=Acetohalobium arabaticum (strain ATCC 49924 / DSM 5501 / Z-7288) TaxID=574087 RepID=D9QRY9_ACEAZ|nr:shikimate dehydrogenase [Acetohalobium arabaticum]ADL13280.1 shikimate 5-dehydrogenase [Acetohalobium arabaticum DSM 5501]
MSLDHLNLEERELVGLFGYPVKHSLSPVMHNTAFSKLDLDYLYLPFEVEPDNLKAAVEGIRGLNLRGVNLTIPHKEAVIPYLDQVSKEAELIGAVNTIKNEAGELIGYNTDGRGFVRSLQEEGFMPQNKNVLIVGAGGAARAVAFQLGLEGVERLYVANRTFKKAEDLVSDIKKGLEMETVQPLPLKQEKLKKIISGIDLLVDTTPIGMHPESDVEPVIEPELIQPDMVVSDLVYNPVETSLLKAAKDRGAKTVSGLGMLVHQGAISFEIWTGKKAPVKLMAETIRDNIELE